jgi:hypothetical protein
MGALVIVHNKTDQPLFYKGISLSSGTQANIQITREFSEHLESPYSACTKDITSDYPSRYVQALLKRNFTYHQSDCFMLCFNVYLIKKCDCYSPSFPTLNDEPNTLLCLNATQLTCTSDAYEYFFAQDISSICDKDLCPLECEFITYVLDVSYADYPSKVCKK